MLPVTVNERKALDTQGSCLVKNGVWCIVGDSGYAIRRVRRPVRRIACCETRDLLLPKLISGEVDVSELDIETERLKPEKRSANSLSVDRAIALRAEMSFA